MAFSEEQLGEIDRRIKNGIEKVVDERLRIGIEQVVDERVKLGITAMVGAGFTDEQTASMDGRIQRIFNVQEAKMITGVTTVAKGVETFHSGVVAMSDKMEKARDALSLQIEEIKSHLNAATKSRRETEDKVTGIQTYVGQQRIDVNKISEGLVALNIEINRKAEETRTQAQAQGQAILQ